MDISPLHNHTPQQSTPPAKRMPQLRWLELGVLILFWGIVALLTIGREVYNPHTAGQSGLREGEALHIILLYGVWMIVTLGLFRLSPRIAPDRIGWLRTVLISVGLGVGVAVFVDLLDHVFWNIFVPSGEPRLISISYILSNFHFLTEYFIYVAALIGGFARAYFIQFQVQQQEAAQLRLGTVQLQAHLAEARLNTLRMQIKPHFLFNTLHVISDHFEEDPRAARRMIARLSDILRYTFEKTEAREVALVEEIRFIQGYLEIQRARFEDRLQVDFEIAPEVHDALIPTLILQPLVENAVQHGVSRIEGLGVILIGAWREEETLHIRVVDNGPGKVNTNGHKRKSSGVGLRNTRERLSTLYGVWHQFTIESPPEGGFEVHISLPYHTQSDFYLASIEE